MGVEEEEEGVDEGEGGGEVEVYGDLVVGGEVSKASLARWMGARTPMPAASGSPSHWRSGHNSALQTWLTLSITSLGRGSFTKNQAIKLDVSFAMKVAFEMSACGNEL